MRMRSNARITNEGTKSRFMICRRSMYPTDVMKTSPHARPNVPITVANRPEFRVPDASAVGMTLLSTDPTTPSNACTEQNTSRYPAMYLLGPTASGIPSLYVSVSVLTKSVTSTSSAIPMAANDMSHIMRTLSSRYWDTHPMKMDMGMVRHPTMVPSVPTCWTAQPYLFLVTMDPALMTLSTVNILEKSRNMQMRTGNVI
mmetsp:Transcript_351/g.812  ORF Transcript_351/g.812 Transcript_351/m.812 type:complete len:200 (-) Transcript_351:1329-1928(-)